MDGGQPPPHWAAPGHNSCRTQTQICSAVASSEQPARCRGHRRSSPGSPGSLRWPGIQVSPSRHTEPSPSHTTGPKGGAGSPAERSGRDQRRSALRSRPRLAQCLLAGSQALRCTWSPRRPLWASGLLASASSTATQAVFAISQAGGAHGRPDMGKKLLLRSQSTQRISGKRHGRQQRKGTVLAWGSDDDRRRWCSAVWQFGRELLGGQGGRGWGKPGGQPHAVLSATGKALPKKKAANPTPASPGSWESVHSGTSRMQGALTGSREEVPYRKSPAAEGSGLSGHCCHRWRSPEQGRPEQGWSSGPSSSGKPS